jgi:glutamyl-tRNA reductase
MGPHDLEARRKTRRSRNLFLIDLAVPRDVDPRIGDMPSVFLYDVDDLSSVAVKSAASRQREAEAAERIVDEIVSDWERRSQAQQITPTVKALRAKLRTSLEAEMSRSLKGRLRGLDDEQRAALAKLLEAGINRILHEPVTRLREEAMRGEAVSTNELASVLSDLFDLEELAVEELDVSSLRYPRSEVPPGPDRESTERESSEESTDQERPELSRVK